MGKGTPFGFYQGNRSEYLAIPALSKLGFTIPVPRQEDRFGIDFIVHLARLDKNTVIPLGKSFGIQIKSNEEPLVFKGQEERDCLFDSAIPFFLGVVSRKDLTITIYNTLNRWCFFWMKGRNKPFQLVPKSTGDGLEAPNHEKGKVWTGKPVLKINIKEQSTAKNRLKEIEELQATMISWVNLENRIISLKEQKVPIVWRPTVYTTNKPLNLGSDSQCRYKLIAYYSTKTLPNICSASEITLVSLSYYLDDCLKRAQSLGKEFMHLIKEQLDDVHKVRKRSKQIREQIVKSMKSKP